MSSPQSPFPVLSRLQDERRSTRAFLNKSVERSLLEDLIREAGKSASGGNLQPWKLYALTGAVKQQLTDNVKVKISEGLFEDSPDIAVYPPKLKSPYRDRRFTCGMALYDALDIARDDQMARGMQWMANFEFFGAPVGMILTIDEQMGPAQFMDIGIYLQSFMLLAQEAGLNTCPQLSWSSWACTVRDTLGLDSSEHVIVGMALGYGDPGQPVNQYDTDRCPLSEFVSIRGYD